MSDDYDLVILGSGSTAFAAALRAHSLGAKAVMIEKSLLGGTCVNWGCIPSKTLIHDALLEYQHHLGRTHGMSVEEEPVELARLMAHKDRIVEHLRKTRYLDVLEKVPGLHVVKGKAQFISSDAVLVGDLTIRGRCFLIATGGNPRIIDIPGLQKVDYLTSRSLLMLNKRPQSLVIIGGGVIALELGQMLLRLGTDVTVMEHGARILPQVDREVAETVRQELEKEGMQIRTNTTICSVDQSAEMSRITAQVGEQTIKIAAERVALATGVSPATEGIGLDKAGVETDSRGFIKVNKHMRTTAAGIWAAGDVTGGMMIATAGAREGIVAVNDMFNHDCRCEMDHLSIPMAIFTDPEVGIVGHTVESAVEAGIAVMTSTLRADAIPKAHVTGNTAGMIKMVADAATGRLLGVHLACDRGADIINEAALAVKFGLTVEDVSSILHVYPSMAEGLRLCAQGFKRDVSMLSCCAE